MDKKTLVLIDHDGTLCQTSPTAYDSLRYALEHAVRTIEATPKFIELDSILSRLTGTTEKRLVQELISIYLVGPEKQQTFEDAFYTGRSNWYKTMKSHNEFVFDTYYPDVESMIQTAFEKGNFIFGLVTGNPSEVIDERLSPHIRHYFEINGKLFGSFGEESISRTELITSAIEKAETSLGFKPILDNLGFAENIFYIGDSKHDFISGIKAKVKTIYIPSRSLQNVKSIKNEEYIDVISSVLPNEILITNDCNSAEAKTFLGI